MRGTARIQPTGVRKVLLLRVWQKPYPVLTSTIRSDRLTARGIQLTALETRMHHVLMSFIPNINVKDEVLSAASQRHAELDRFNTDTADKINLRRLIRSHEWQLEAVLMDEGFRSWYGQNFWKMLYDFEPWYENIMRRLREIIVFLEEPPEGR